MLDWGDYAAAAMPGVVLQPQGFRLALTTPSSAKARHDALSTMVNESLIVNVLR